MRGYIRKGKVVLFFYSFLGMFVILKNSSGTSFPDVLRGVKEYLNPLLNVAVPCPSCCHTALVPTHLLLSHQQSQVSLSFSPSLPPCSVLAFSSLADPAPEGSPLEV